MKVSLKKAAALALALGAVSVPIPTGLNFSIYDDPLLLEPKLKDAETQHNLALKRAGDVISATYAIRLLVGQANAGAISALVTERAMVEKQLAMIGKIPIVDKQPDVEAILRRIESLKETPKTSSYSSPPDAVGISTQNATEITPILKIWKKRKLAIDDELAHLNFTTEIELPDDVVAILREYDLI